MPLLHATLLLFGTAQGSDYPSNAVPPLRGVTVPGLPAISGNLHVDQFGYLPTEAKVAVLVDPQRGYNAKDHYTPGPRIEVRERRTGKVVASGAPKAWRNGAIHEDSGDRGWWFDFTRLKTPGEYYVLDPKAKLRSPVFQIGAGTFHPILRAATRMFYYQREAVPIQAPYAEKPWVGGPILLQDKKARAVWDKNNPRLERDLSGGWMDAGDTNKYPPFNGDVLHPLLYAYRANPKAFGDNFGIPESGNGRPDLLDEIKVQLDWLLKMQDKNGAVPVKMGNIDYNGVQPLTNDKRTRYYGPNDSGAAIYTAANFAHAARVYGQFPAWRGYAKTLQDRALRGWKWFQTNPRTYKQDSGEIKSGGANRSKEDQDRMEAYTAIHLYALTQKPEFQKVIREKVGTTRQLSEDVWSPYESGASEALVDYLTMKGADPQVKKRIRDQLAKSARSPRSAPPADADLYRAWMNPDAYHWGSNFVRAGFGVVALLEAKHGGLNKAEQVRLRQRAADMLHSFHGVNPLAAVYLSNMGRYGAERSMMTIYHDRYGFATPFKKNPPPGYVVGGPNQQFSGTSPKKLVEWIKSQPRAKAYGDFNDAWPESSWELSEPAIYYQAMYIRLLAEFARK